MSMPSKWRLLRYVDNNGTEPFSVWLNKLDTTIQRRIRLALARIEAGNLSSVKWIGGNLGEFRLDTGPGYRIYLTRHGHDELVLLIAGDKGSQQRDVTKAKEFIAALKDS